MKLKNIELNDFYVGYEVEGCLNSEENISFSNFERKIHAIHPKINIGDDGSINTKKSFDESFEIRTPPLKVKESIEVLKKVLNLVNEYGYTNSSTGLHASFSPICNDLYKKINPNYLSNLKLFKDIAEYFRRKSNPFCSFYGSKINKNKLKKYIKEHPSFLQIIKNKSALWQKCLNDYEKKYPFFKMSRSSYYCEHYSAVNFQHFTSKRNKSSRIEVRVMGNTNYHKKYDKIVDYTDKIIGAIKKSTEIELI